MSATASSTQSRVAAELEALCAPGAELHKDSVRSTWSFYGDDRPRLRQWDEMIEEYLARQLKVTEGGRLLVVTAGSPGAGKSRAVAVALDGVADVDTYRVIDPDIIKDQIIERALHTGIYEDYLRNYLSDGGPIRPRELSGLVHEESVRIARRLRRLCMRRGENLIVEGMLSSREAVDEHLGAVTYSGYDALDVISVDVPREVARERVIARWWEGRTDPGSRLGGRFVPQAVVDGCWTPDDRSKCATNAHELHLRAIRQEGLETNLYEVSADQQAGGDAIAPVVHLRSGGGGSSVS